MAYPETQSFDQAKKAHKPGERPPCCALGHLKRRGKVWQLYIYEIKTLFCGLFGQTYENFPLYGILLHGKGSTIAIVKFANWLKRNH